jgi:hypothetical protein
VEKRRKGRGEAGMGRTKEEDEQERKYRQQLLEDEK